MRTPCEVVAGRAPRLRGSVGSSSPRLSQHVATCLACQAEIARYRRMARLLDQLGRERRDVPPRLLAEVLASAERAARGARRSASAGTRALVAGCTAAGLAVAAVAALAVGRREATRA